MVATFFLGVILLKGWGNTFKISYRYSRALDSCLPVLPSSGPLLVNTVISLSLTLLLMDELASSPAVELQKAA